MRAARRLLLALALAAAVGAQPAAAAAQGAAQAQTVEAGRGTAAADTGVPALNDARTQARGDAPAAPAVPFGSPVQGVSPDAAALRRAVLIVDPERLYAASAWGRRAEAEIARRTRAVSDENDRIYAELSAAEDELTAARATLAPDAFRARAAAFDARVTEVRRDREAAARAVGQQADRERSLFLRAAGPVMAQLMVDRGALVTLDRRSVLYADDSLDATADLVGRLDAALGDGAQIVAGQTGEDAAPAVDAGAEDVTGAASVTEDGSDTQDSPAEANSGAGPDAPAAAAVPDAGSDAPAPPAAVDAGPDASAVPRH